MNRKKFAFRPQTMALEPIALLSVSGMPVPDSAEVRPLGKRQGAAIPATTSDRLEGQYIAGEDNRAADAPLHVVLGGNGKTKALGMVNFSGSLDLGGFRVANSPEVTGTLTLINSRGSLILRLSGSGGFVQIPNGRIVTSARVTGSTGAYENLQRTGTVTFQFSSAKRQPTESPGETGGGVMISLNLKARGR